MFKKILSVFLCALTVACSLVSLVGCTTDNGYDENCTNVDYNLTENIADGTILHCFCWDFETIINSMEDIAAAGYSAIQTSPINECYIGEDGGMQLYGEGKWYYHFQPTDYTIGNYQLGTKEEFKAMCAKADEYGIKVIVDVVPNHTSFTTEAVNENLLNAVGGYDKLYHKNSTKDIADYGDRLQCTTYKMGGLPDINTENPDYQDYFINFLNECIECGADGFRYDCAKHIAMPDDPVEKEGDVNNFWTRVTTEITDAERIFNYGEVLQGNNDRIVDYIKVIGRTTSSSYGDALRSAVMKGNIDTAFVSDFKVGSDKSVVTWVESHDNYINDGNWMGMTGEQVKLAYAIIAARKDGTPLFFNRPYGSSIDSQWGTMNRIGPSGNFDYKDESVVAVNFFRNAMVGEEESMMNCDDESKSLQICRGDKGAVIVNLAGELEVNFETDLADGKYTDRVDNTTVYTVKDGIITCDTPIKENSIVVLYNEGYTQYAKPATVKIDDSISCIHGEEEIEVKLCAENATEAQYSLNDAEAVSYKDGDTVTIKAEDGEEGINKLVLTATSKAGQKTYMEYYFTYDGNIRSSGQVKEGDTIAFEKPAEWGETIYAYIYNENGGENAPWPGEQMEFIVDTTYGYTMTQDWMSSYVIFNDGTNQYPGQNEKGFDLEANLTYKVE